MQKYTEEIKDAGLPAKPKKHGPKGPWGKCRGCGAMLSLALLAATTCAVKTDGVAAIGPTK